MNSRVRSIKLEASSSVQVGERAVCTNPVLAPKPPDREAYWLHSSGELSEWLYQGLYQRLLSGPGGSESLPAMGLGIRRSSPVAVKRRLSNDRLSLRSDPE